jgi:enoyl-CoA hydratase
VTTGEPLLVEDRGSIRIIRLNRPAAGNAIDPELHEALFHAVRDLDGAAAVRAAVITGADGIFSAGGDRNLIRQMQTNVAVRNATLDTAQALFGELTSTGVPIVAAVNGPAVGAGCTLALLCDVVIMGDDTYLADPHVAVGLVPGDGGVVLWPQLAGLGRAKAYLLTGDRVSAAECWRLGLAHEVVNGDPFPQAVALAERIAARPAFAVQETKRALNLHLRAAGMPFAYALDAERASFDDDEHRGLTR